MNIQKNESKNECGGWSRDCQEKEIPAHSKTCPLEPTLKNLEAKSAKNIHENLYDTKYFLSDDYEISEKSERLKLYDAIEKRIDEKEKWYINEIATELLWRGLETDPMEKEFYKKLKERNQHHYAITLTLDANEWEKLNDSDKKYYITRMEKSCKSICKGKHISESDWQLERTKRGTPHIHIYLKSKEYIKRQTLKDKYKINFGFVWMEKCKNVKGYKNYIAKERDIEFEGKDPGEKDIEDSIIV